MTTRNQNSIGATPSIVAHDGEDGPRRIFRYAMLAAMTWTAAVGVSAAWNILGEREQVAEMARIEARSHFNKDLAFRLWGTRHGGVYVPADARTPPNPNLDRITERDIATPSGRQLTLMNPAYMVRQLMEEYSELYGVRGRITSLKPLRPENAPDPWETSALRAFEHGQGEVLEYTTIDGQPYLRLMRPMVTQEGCLKCHEQQGYKIGDIRGGIGVSVPMEPYRRNERHEIAVISATHGTIWLLGLGLIGVASQGARRREAERASADRNLRGLLHRNQALLDAAGEGIYGIDAEGHTTFVNPAACRMLGFVADEIVGHDQHVLFHHTHADGAPYAHADCPIAQTLADGQPRLISGETFWRKDGTSFPVELVTAPLAGNSGGVVVAFHDISERIRAHHEKDRLVDELKRSNAALQQFAYAASHDLQEPLRMVTNFLQLLERRQANLDDEGRECIAFAVDGAKRMSHMIDGLLTYSRVHTAGASLAPTQAEAALGEALANLRLAIEESGADLRHSPLPPVIGDPGQLTSLFQNLIGNAIKYRAKDRPLRIAIDAQRRGAMWEFAVADNGIGIDPQHHERIFGIFQRLHNRADYPGAGVGLAVCQKIVERHGGRIWVESKLDQGASFRFTLPAAG